MWYNAIIRKENQTIKVIKIIKDKILEKEVAELLSSKFQILMLLEENPNNKWILNNKDWRDKNE